MNLLDRFKSIPEAWRLLRVNMTHGRPMAMATLSIFICTLIFLYPYTQSPEARIPHLILILLYYFALWNLVAPIVVAQTLWQEFTQKTWVFQQITPQRAMTLIAGKFIGGLGTVYTMSLAAAPFLIAALIMQLRSIADVFIFFVVVFVFFFLCSSFLLYVTSITGESQGIRPVFMIIILIGSLWFITGSVPIFGRGNIGLMNPMSLLFSETFSNIAENKRADIVFIYPSGSQVTTQGNNQLIEDHNNDDPDNASTFYNINFSPWFLAVILYLVGGLILFFSAEGHLLRQMNLGRSRLPILLSFFIIAWIFCGFSAKPVGIDPHASYHEEIVTVFVLLYSNAGMFFLLAGTILLHARAKVDVRPWALQRPSSGVAHLFSDNAPVVYFIPLLLVIYTFTTLFLQWNLTQENFQWQPFLIQVILMWVIVLRDAYFLQTMQLTVSSAQKFAALIYIFVFGGLTLFFSLVSPDFPLDLTPILALSYSVRDYSPYNASLTREIITYIISNLAILIACHILFRREIKKLQEPLRKEFDNV